MLISLNVCNTFDWHSLTSKIIQNNLKSISHPLNCVTYTKTFVLISNRPHHCGSESRPAHFAAVCFLWQFVLKTRDRRLRMLQEHWRSKMTFLPLLSIIVLVTIGLITIRDSSAAASGMYPAYSKFSYFISYSKYLNKMKFHSEYCSWFGFIRIFRN